MSKRKTMTLEEIEHHFGRLDYRELTGGWVELQGAFEDRFLISVELPCIYKPRRMHRKIMPSVSKALHVIERNAEFDPDYEYIEEMQFWAPRHIAYDKKRRLSSHTWGIAFDINPWENMPGASNPAIPDKIVQIFENVGFIWGGRFSNKDYMHFEPRPDFFDFENRWI